MDLGLEDADGGGLCRLPSLGGDYALIPKDFEAKIIKDSCVRRLASPAILHRLTEATEERSLPGIYAAGPPGAGKSVINYSIACAARTQGWLVVYVVS
jgi:predicted PilT family ATPase